MADWHGNEALAPLVKSMRGLKPHPRNPRIGDTQAVYASLQRFGQQRPILVDGDRQIVAGNTTFKAAKQLGWKRIAWLRTDLTDTQEIERYLVADNRTSDLAVYDQTELASLLAEQRTLDGTGYTADDLELMQAVAAADAATRPAAPDVAAMRIVLRYPEETYRRITGALDTLMAEHGLDTYSDAVEKKLWSI